MAGEAPTAGKIPRDQWPGDLHPAFHRWGLDSLHLRGMPVSSLSPTTSTAVNAAYSDVQRASGHIGGEAHGGAIYGEMAKGDMQRLIEVLRTVTQLNRGSVFLDIGAGLGKPSIHVAIEIGCLAIGVEYMATRFNLSIANLKRLNRDASPVKRGVQGQSGPLRQLGSPTVMFCCEDAWRMGSVDPTTHLFMFDVGIPEALMRHVAALFRRSKTADYVIFYR